MTDGDALMQSTATPSQTDLSAQRLNAVRFELRTKQQAWTKACIADICNPAKARDGSHNYALINPLSCDFSATQALIEMHGLPVVPLYLQTPEAEHAAQGPQLLQLPCAPWPAELLDTLAQLAAQQALSLMISPVELHELAGHLSRALDAQLHDGSPAQLRYFDPRNGFAVMQVLPETARAHFLTPLTHWIGWRRDFTVIQVKPHTRPHRHRSSCLAGSA